MRLYVNAQNSSYTGDLSPVSNFQPNIYISNNYKLFIWKRFPKTWHQMELSHAELFYLLITF